MGKNNLSRPYPHHALALSLGLVTSGGLACSAASSPPTLEDAEADADSQMDVVIEAYYSAESRVLAEDAEASSQPVVSAVEGSGPGVAAAPIPHGACLDGIEAFGSAGPFQSTTQRSGNVNFYVPQVPAGCKVPVVHLANGTGARCSTYGSTLRRLASHGFLAACYESTNTGAGDQGLEALDRALQTFPNLADNKFGSTGHSQGGQAAFTVLALAEKKYGDRLVYAGLAMQPASGFGAQPRGTTWRALYGGLKSPMFMFSGLRTDGLVSQSWVRSAYDATSATEEAYFWARSGSSHIPVPNTETQQVAIPWFRWKLLGDIAACRAFKALPTKDGAWRPVASKNEKACD
jgi:hypothetical protein